MPIKPFQSLRALDFRDFHLVVSGTAELEEFGDQRQEAEGMSWEWVVRVCVCVCQIAG